MAIEYKRNKIGQLEAFEDGVSLGLVETTGDWEEDEEISKKLYDANLIRKLLKMYGVSEKEIENFINDLDIYSEEEADEVK